MLYHSTWELKLWTETGDMNDELQRTDTALTPTDGTGSEVGTGSDRLPGDDHLTIILRLLEKSPTALNIVAGTLSLGSVAALFYFIYLCSVKPDFANLMIPLILAPLYKRLLDHARVVIQDRMKKKEQEPKPKQIEQDQDPC